MPRNPYYEAEQIAREPRITFSRTELLHLATSVAVLTAAFAFVQNHNGILFDPANLIVPGVVWIAAFLAVASGFVLHELAHKIVAQKFHHWAEFRGWFRGLLVSLLIAAGGGILFAAPGAVNIWGRVTPRENGLISIVGPGINFVIAIAMFPVAFFGDLVIENPVIYSAAIVSNVNALLCLFNMLPIMNLDGRKVLAWNKPVYFVFVALAVGLLVLSWVAGIWAMGPTP